MNRPTVDSNEPCTTVAIVVDPDFGDSLSSLVSNYSSAGLAASWRAFAVTNRFDRSLGTRATLSLRDEFSKHGFKISSERPDGFRAVR